MTSENPLVSVLMTAYNRQQFIGEAIESVLACTYQNWELIIVDDGSNDNTVAIAKKFEAADKRIHVHINEKNLGDYPNRNKAISYATGEYIMFCDSDDTLRPESIFKMINLVGEKSDFNFAMSWPQFKEPVFLSSTEALRKHFFESQFLFIGPGGTFMRRSFVNQIGGYPIKYGPANDMYFNLKAVCNTTVLLFAFDLQYYREHEGQEIKNNYSYLYNGFRYLNDALNELPLPFSKKEITWLRKKNYRRFVVNLFNFLRESRDLKKTAMAWKLANFNSAYLLQGIFH